MNAPNTPAAGAAAATARWTKIIRDGTPLPPDHAGTDHVAVIDKQTGLMWAVSSIGDPNDPDTGLAQQEAEEACRQLDLLGQTDWHLPSRAELVTLIDDTRSKPAIDTDAFPYVLPNWHWTSTPAAWSSASAWGVLFSLGLVSDFRRYYDGFALAVRRAGQ